MKYSSDHVANSKSILKGLVTGIIIALVFVIMWYLFGESLVDNLRGE